MIFIFGMERSGTTWLAKLFDSHPDVLYRHEPDAVLPGSPIPFLCHNDEVETHLPAMRSYIEALTHVRTLRSAGSLPIFPKSYYTPFQYYFHKNYIYGLRVLEGLSVRKNWLTTLQIPDLVDIGAHSQVRFVVKSVSAMGRMNLFTRAMPESRTILLLRHPCGQVASVMRGVSIGKLSSKAPIKSLTVTDQARRRGLSVERVDAMTPIERLAWRWVILNEKAIEELPNSDGAMVLQYENLCERPEEVAKQLFEFAGLSWHPQAETFVRESTSHSGQERYYQVFRNPQKSANKWKNELSGEEIKTILDIARQTSFGQQFA